MNASKAQARCEPASRPMLDLVIDSFGLPISAIPHRVLLDDDNRIRRIAVDFPFVEADPGAPGVTHLSFELTDFSKPVDIRAPVGEQLVDIDELGGD